MSDIKSIRFDMASKAKHYVGKVKEIGENEGVLVEHFQKAAGYEPDGQPWCACFCITIAMECLDKTLNNPAALRARLNEDYFLPSGRCESIRQDAIKRGTWRNNLTQPSMGWLVLFQFDKDKEADHIGIVLRSKSPKVIETIEGNTVSGESGSQANGNGVFLRYRNVSKILGYVAIP